MPRGLSFAQYLQSVDEELGLIAEIDFRKHHFESLRHWQNSERILSFKYEQILGHEKAVFREIFSFYELSSYERQIGAWLADRFSLRHRRADSHIRDARPGQWKRHFTPRVAAYSNDRYADLIELLDY